MATGNGEVAAPIVSLETPLAVASRWQRPPHQHVHARPRWADLREGVQLLDDLLGPVLYLSRVRVEAVVQVNAAEVVFRREHETYTIVALFLTGLHSFLIAGPCLRGRAACSLSRER